jgi:UDP-glucose 4-epimerase
MLQAASLAGKRVLVTGGAGFIGSHLCDHLLKLDATVVVMDNLSTGRAENLRHLSPHITSGQLSFIQADLNAMDPAGRMILDRGPFDRIFHLAAAVGVQLVISKPIESIETNVLTTAAILRLAGRAGPGGAPCPTLICSSSEVYGKSDRTPFAEEDDVVYGPTTKARWSYAASKALDEYLAMAHHQQQGLPAVIVRFFNTVGPRQVGTYGMVLPSFVASALKGESLKVFGDGHQQRCFCDVRDVVRALPVLLQDQACYGQVFNLGSDQLISIRELAELVIKTLASRSEITMVPYERAYASGFEDLRSRQPDLRKIRRQIGFVPSISLVQTIQDIARHMQADVIQSASSSTRTTSRGDA